MVSSSRFTHLMPQSATILGQYFCGMRKISIGIKTYFCQFIDKFLKFEEMEYLIHHVKFEMWPALFKFPILFSTVKPKLGHKFSQLIIRFKIGDFGILVLGCTSKFFPIHKETRNWDFECCSSWTFQFFPTYGRD